MTAPHPVPAADLDPIDEVASSDLFFSLSAILIVLLCLLSGPLRASLAATDTSAAALLASARQSGIAVIVATEGGATLQAPAYPALFLPLDAILGPDLAPWLRDLAAPPLLLVLPDARDSAFLLDTALAQAGVATIRRVRLSGPCLRPRILPQGVTCDG